MLSFRNLECYILCDSLKLHLQRFLTHCQAVSRKQSVTTVEELPVSGKLSLCDHRLFKLTVKRGVLMSWIQNEKSDNKNLKQKFSMLKVQTTNKPQFHSR